MMSWARETLTAWVVFSLEHLLNNLEADAASITTVPLKMLGTNKSLTLPRKKR